MKDVVTLAVVLGLAGCGASRQAESGLVPGGPVPVGVGPQFHPPALSVATRKGTMVAGVQCRLASGARYLAHLEVFADRRVVAIPPGVGIAPPQVRRGAFVRGGRCSYPLRTVEPTGVIEVARGRRFTLGDFFAIWGEPLSARHVAGFRAGRGDRVRAYVSGRLWRGDIRAIPLSRHAVIALVVGGRVFVHPTYTFVR